jgi:TorA maturation chaperone TorD
MSLAPEEQARADLYGLLARLFYAAPDPQFLSELRQFAPSPEPGTGDPLAAAWRELSDACRGAFPPLLENEHTELFIGTGHAEISPYLTHYTMRHESDTPLVGLRAQLAGWGIARRESVHEPEDHIASLCETMRFAIAVQQRSIEEQRDFFERYIAPGATRFLAALLTSENARFYKPVAKLARAFFEIEHEAFSIAG